MARENHEHNQLYGMLLPLHSRREFKGRTNCYYSSRESTAFIFTQAHLLSNMVALSSSVHQKILCQNCVIRTFIAMKLEKKSGSWKTSWFTVLNL